ncbi:MAG: DUF4907 domain-containing protein [Draconibacterium sp.]
MMKIIRIKNTRVFSWIVLFMVVVGLTAMKSLSVIQHNKQQQQSEYSLKTFRIEENEWGYYIMKGGKIIIKQDMIPAISKKASFQSESDAKKTGSLVLQKLNSGNLPAVTLQELRQLQIVD